MVYVTLLELPTTGSFEGLLYVDHRKRVRKGKVFDAPTEVVANRSRNCNTADAAKEPGGHGATLCQRTVGVF